MEDVAAISTETAAAAEEVTASAEEVNATIKSPSPHKIWLTILFKSKLVN